MANFQGIPRRHFLAGAGATLGQAAISASPASAQQIMSGAQQLLTSTRQFLAGTRTRRASLPYSIPSANNPFFAPIGSARSGTMPLPPMRTGTGFRSGATASGLTQAAAATGPDALAPTGASTLVLYDTTDQWGWLGELYGMMMANLASHFGTWTVMPVVSYTQGLLNQYSAVIYVGSTYGEPLPAAFLNDVVSTNVPVIWIYDNIWELTASYPSFSSVYGWMWSGFDFSTVGEVDYKSQKLKRYAANAAGIMNYATIGTGVTVLANAVRSDGSTFPWAIRSRNLTYIGENPLVYISEGDRYLIFCDLLFDTLAPNTATRHRATLRIEDINVVDDPTQLMSAATWLFSQGVPFGFQAIPLYLDPNGFYNNGTPVNAPLRNFPAMIAAFKSMQLMGGTMMLHGWTHQYSNIANPYTAVSGDDTEFYRITQNPDLTLNYLGPVAEDTSIAWSANRLTSAFAELTASGFAVPQLWTFPSYAGTVFDYQAVTAAQVNGQPAFIARAERSLYFSGFLSGGTIDYTRTVGQYFPYTVYDVYKCNVLADTLGGIEPLPFGPFPARLPADIIADAQRALVVRDGFASFFYHASDNIALLQETVNGLKSLGYTFVAPAPN